MRFLVALAVLLTAAPSIPQEPPQWTDAIPPVRFQAVGFAPVFYVPSNQVQELCGLTPPEGMVVIACTRSVEINGKQARVIVMPDPCEIAGLDAYAAIQCHENAHLLSGWKHETE